MLQKLKKLNLFKWLLFSIIIHLIAFSLLPEKICQLPLSKNNPNKQNVPINIGITGKLIPKTQKSTKVKDIEVATVAKSNVVIKKAKKKALRKKTEKGYYGIGVHMDVFTDITVNYNGQSYVGEKITKVIETYPAHEVDLKIDDVIFMINNKPISFKNSPRGDKPQWLVIGIKRGNSIFFVEVYRDWISIE